MPIRAAAVAVATPCWPAPVSAIRRVLPIFFRQQRLTEHVVDLMCAGVVQILAFEVDLRTAEVVCHVLRKVQARRTACVVVQQLGQLCVEYRVVLIVVIGFFQLDDSVHQRFRHILAAMYAKNVPCSLVCSFHERRHAAHLVHILCTVRFDAAGQVERIRAGLCGLFDVGFIQPACEKIRVVYLADQRPVERFAAAAIGVLFT